MAKRWGLGIGSFFSLLVVYFIFLYSKEKEWVLLSILSKWYLIIVGGFFALSIGIVLLVLLISLLLILYNIFRFRKSKPKAKKKEAKYIDADFQLKE
ncbi:MAG TPA: hypothetical protein VI564_00120 [Candidatus Nanoarchaeia archaeon]|nr:hypothetical protein [Candidatus Nanoarchaeia archaeon]